MPVTGEEPVREAAFHAVIEGEVQGVGFRYSAAREARSLGLSGWVRNAEDGSVEVWAEGDRASLQEFFAWLRRGPETAWVSAVTRNEEKPRGVYSTFSIVF